MNNQRVPKCFVAIGYDDVYDDFAGVNPKKLLEGIPTVAVLNFVAREYAKICCAKSGINTMRQQIRDFCPYLTVERKKRVWRFINETEKVGNHAFLYGTIGCQMFYRLALQTYTPLEDGDDLELYEDEFEPLFKTVLYCNKLWTDKQLSKKDITLSDLLLKMDILIAEGKQRKDIIPQLYKADKFFTFCENDITFKEYLPHFYQDKKVNNWGEYMVLLFNIYTYSTKNHILFPENTMEQQFLSQFVINESDPEVKTLWDAENKGVNYLRNHFLFTMPDGKYLLLDANFLLDKIYQGLRFDLFKTIKTHHLTNAKGKQYKDLPEFNSTLGRVFSEKHLLYTLLKNTYNDENTIHFTGEKLKSVGIIGEPDYYLRIDDTLFLIEYKDLLFPDVLRFTDDIENIKQGIIDRICLDNGKKRKGGGQLMFAIDQILNHGQMDKLDNEVKNIKKIFPLIVITDTAFSSMGVNNTVTEAFDVIYKRYNINKQVLTLIPVVINLDTLIQLSYRLHTKKIQLDCLLLDYLNSNWRNLSSFDNYVYNMCMESVKDRERAISFLFTQMVAKVARMLETKPKITTK